MLKGHSMQSKVKCLKIYIVYLLGLGRLGLGQEFGKVRITKGFIYQAKSVDWVQ